MMQHANELLSSKGGNNQCRPISQVRIMLAILAFIAVGCGMTGMKAGAAAPAKKEADPAIVAKCQADLVQRYKLQARDITVAETQATTWPDAALGIPEMGKVYAQVMTPGWKIVLDVKGSRYLYTTGKNAIKYGGPLVLWSASMLYVKPVPDEANMNGDLYQCSLFGTNHTRLVAGVTAYYPQEKGVVIIKRRTSRSSHELLYVKAVDAKKARTLHTAFDFGEAAMNNAQDEWAGFVRTAVGGAWNIMVARIGQDDTRVQTLPLPDGVQPGQIAWSGEKLMILVKQDEKTVCFETTPRADAPAWKAVAVHTFTGMKSFMLNKSESLEITQIKEEGKPCVEVVRVWFNGDRNVKAKISGVTLRGYDLLGAGYAFLWGELDGKSVAYTVNIVTGEVIPSACEAGRDIKPFICPPVSAP